MSGWLTFWEISLVVSGVAFAVISVIVAVRGFGDLRQTSSWPWSPRARM